MRTYTIGEAIENFKNIDDLAYIFDGEMKGTLLYCDRVNDNRLTSRYPNGEYSQALFIGFNFNITKEEGRKIAFYHELIEDAVEDHDEKIVNIILEIQEQITNIGNDFIRDFNELSVQEQAEVVEFLNNEKMIDKNKK